MAIRKTLSAAEARIAVGRLAPRRKSAGSAGLVLRLRSPGPVPVCRLVAGGGHLYDSRGSEVPESAVLRLGLQGPSRPQELCAGTLPGHDAGRCGTGRRRRACGAGKPGGRAVSVTAPIPAVRDQAFSCPWLPGSRGARTCSGRRRPQTCLAAHIRWSARLTRVEGERSVNRRLSLRWFEPNTCHHLRKRPPGCGYAPGRPFSSRHAVYRGASP
jgi:hypothetical protein